MATTRDDQLYVIGIQEERLGQRLRRLTFTTTRGDLKALLHTKPRVNAGVIMLGGFNGGLDGPDSIYPDLAASLLDYDIASLRLDYRQPGSCAQCGIDALMALQYFDDESVHDVILVGWSFGGAVALGAGSVAKSVRGISAISTVEIADCCARRLRSKPVLLLHGESDLESPVEWPRRIHSQAKGPCRFIIYPGAGHNLTEVHDVVLDDLVSWIVSTFESIRKAA